MIGGVYMDKSIAANKNICDILSGAHDDIKKIKVTHIEIIVTGTKEKPYFEIRYKVLGNNYYNIGYSSYDLNIVFDWKERYFSLVCKEDKE